LKAIHPEGKPAMSLHRSLTTSGRARRHRNVLSREERMAKLEEDGRWDEEKSVFGLPKVRSIKPVVSGKKKKKDKPDEVEGVPAEGAAEGEAAAVEHTGAQPEGGAEAKK